MSRALYEIDSAIVALLENGFTVDEETGEVLGGAEELEQLQMERQEKLEGIALFVKMEEMLIGDISAEIAALRERKSRHEAKVKRIKDYLMSSMTAAGESKVETATVEISVRNCPPAVRVVDESKIADKFFREKVTRDLSLTDIKNAIKAGEIVEGAVLETKRSVLIK